MAILPSREEILEHRRRAHGAIHVEVNAPIRDESVLSVVYTPGVAEPCLEIHRDPDKAYEYTIKANTVAVVTDGTAVLGLGDIGALAGLPVMEGKAALFKTFAGVDAFPILIDSKDVDEIVRTVRMIAPGFGGINLEDISAPRCFEIERRLKEEIDIPVFHDDQHGTAIVTLAAVLGALRVVGKDLADVHIAINGAGASGIAVTRMLLLAGAKEITLCDTKGCLYEGRAEGMNPEKEAMARITNRARVTGGLADAMKDADVFIGLSVAGAVSQDMVRSMAGGAIVLAMANPTPEIFPDEARAAGARVVGTGRSDFPNQVNNVQGFPGVFRGALDVRARVINDEMKLAAAKAIASFVPDSELSPDYIIPRAMDLRVAPAVARAVAEAAIRTGVARVAVDPAQVERDTLRFLYEGRLRNA